MSNKSRVVDVPRQQNRNECRAFLAVSGLMPNDGIHIMPEAPAAGAAAKYVVLHALEAMLFVPLLIVASV